MKKKIALALTITMIMMLLSGCGEAMYKLTPDEERIIATYSAKMVAKYNKFQDEGLCYVRQEQINRDVVAVVSDGDEEVAEDIEELPDETANEDATDSGPIDVADIDAADMTAAPVIEQGSGIAPVNPGAPITHITPTNQATTIGDTLGYPQLSVNVEEIFTADEYKEGSYFIMTPSNGNRYLVCYVSLENTSGSEVDCNIGATGAKLVATMGDGTVAESINAFLGDDFGQFSGQIGTGVLVSTVALIEIPASCADDLYGMKLRVETADGSYCDVY